MSIKTLTTHELLVAFSALQNMPILHIRYPSEDRNEKSRSAVAHSLRDSGFFDAALAIDNGVTFITLESPAEAVRLREAIESHSAALSAHLFWKGLENEQVSEAVLTARHDAERNAHAPRFGHNHG